MQPRCDVTSVFWDDSKRDPSIEEILCDLPVVASKMLQPTFFLVFGSHIDILFDVFPQHQWTWAMFDEIGGAFFPQQQCCGWKIIDNFNIEKAKNCLEIIDHSLNDEHDDLSSHIQENAFSVQECGDRRESLDKMRILLEIIHDLNSTKKNLLLKLLSFQLA